MKEMAGHLALAHEIPINLNTLQISSIHKAFRIHKAIQIYVDVPK